MNSRSINSHSSHVGCSNDGNKLVGSGDTTNSCSRGNDRNGSTIISSDSSCNSSNSSGSKLGYDEVNSTSRSSIVGMGVPAGL